MTNATIVRAARNPQTGEPWQSPPSVVSLDYDHIEITGFLGSGSFASVYSVAIENELLLLSSSDDSSSSKPNDSSKSSLSQEDSASTLLQASASSWGSTDSQKSTFALKSLNTDILDEAGPKKRNRASLDLTKEARILAKLPEHPHIIRLCGLSRDFWEAEDTSSTSFRYIVLEKLDATLQERLTQWRKTRVDSPATETTKSLLREEQKERLHTTGAVGIAQALRFLHKHKIIYRDIKPHNIGYAADGQARLFDFGLAREIVEDDDRKLTGLTGTLRYMAPEVARRQMYSFSADIYSLAMLLFEIVTLEKPYALAESQSQLKRWVSSRINSPTTHGIVSQRVERILTACWDLDPLARPSLQQVTRTLASVTSSSSSRSDGSSSSRSRKIVYTE